MFGTDFGVRKFEVIFSKANNLSLCVCFSLRKFVRTICPFFSLLPRYNSHKVSIRLHKKYSKLFVSKQKGGTLPLKFIASYLSWKADFLIFSINRSSSTIRLKAHGIKVTWITQSEHKLIDLKSAKTNSRLV